jgi:hypothetical protein
VQLHIRFDKEALFSPILLYEYNLKTWMDFDLD